MQRTRGEMNLSAKTHTMSDFYEFEQVLSSDLNLVSQNLIENLNSIQKFDIISQRTIKYQRQ